MKVSFDFDNTLSREAVQKFAKELMQKRYEVHIVTSRFEDPMCYTDPRIQETGHRDMFRVCFYLGIPKERIHFTNMIDKAGFFENNPDFLFHLDDDEREIFGINTYTTVKGILCDKGILWKKEIEKGFIIEESQTRNPEPI
jgi:hypothetical protein